MTTLARFYRTFAALFACGFFLPAVPALADVTVTVKENGVDQTYFFTSDKMAMKGPEGVFVFDSQAETVQMTDPKGNMRTLTKKDLESMAAMSKGTGASGSVTNDQMAEARKQAEEALKDLPPEQQAQARKILDMQLGNAPGALTVSKTYEPLNKSQDVNGYSCKGYAIKKGDERLGETWVASLDAMDLTKKDLAVMGKLRAFFGTAFEGSAMGKSSMTQMDRLDPESDLFIGFPVRTVETEDGKEKVTELSGIMKGKVDPKVFEIAAK